MKARIRAASQQDPSQSPRWELGYLEAAEKDARKFLTDEQYAHAVELFESLACEPEPTRSKTQRVEKVQEFYELKDKGGILGKINLRVYFALVKKRLLILVLAVYKKEEEEKTPPHIVIRIRNRFRAAMRQLE